MKVYDLIYNLFIFIFGESIVSSMPYSFLVRCICFILCFVLFYFLIFWLPNKFIFRCLHQRRDK